MAIDVLAGPGCLGVKRADADALLAELGDDAVLIDSTSIYRSLGGKAASPETDSQLFRVARVMAGAAVRQANEQGLNGIVTSSSGRRSRLTSLAEAGGGGRIFVADPGRAVVCERLKKLIPTDTARRAACEQGLSRWYANYAAADTDIELSGKRERGTMSEFRCAIEVREDAGGGPGRIVGTLLTYNEKASDRPEVFRQGSLSWPEDGIVLREQHDRAQPIARVVPELRGDKVIIDALLPDTGRARDAVTMIREGVFRGLSVEFAGAKSSQVSGIRFIDSARLVGAGLVDDPSYSGSRVDVRSKGKARPRRVWL